MITKDQFFNSKNTPGKTGKSEVEPTFIEALEAMARTTYESIYVIDYFTQAFDFVSAHPLFLCGCTAEEFREMGYDFYLKHTPKEDQKLLLIINEVGFDFYEKLPIEERLFYSITYDFRLIHKNGKAFLVNHKYTPLTLSAEGKIRKAVCVFSLATNDTPGNIKIRKETTGESWNFNLETGRWQYRAAEKLSEREQDILLLSAQGFSVKEMSEQMHISPDTVKFHRKKLFEKLEVDSISAALSKATSNKML